MPAQEIRAGRAYVEAVLKDKLTPQLAKIEKRLKETGEKVSSMGAKIGLAGAAIVTAFVPAIKAASDLNESMSKFGVVFGAREKDVKKWADTTAKEVGRSKKVVADFAARAQNLFVPLGVDPAAAEEMTKTLTQLAIDLGSFNNVSDDEAFEKLMSGMLGESEPLKAMGIIVNDTATKMELMNQKLDPEKATDSQKAFARLNIIMRATKAAQGDAARTADGFANQLKRIQGEAFDAAAALGTAVLPLVTNFVSKLTEGVVAVSDWVEANKDTAKAYGELIIEAAGVAIAIGAGLVVLGKLIGLAGAAAGAIKGLSLAFAFLAANPLVAVGIGLAALVGGLIGYAKVRSIIATLTATTNDAMFKQADAFRDAASGMKDNLDQIKQLGQKTTLTTQEQKSAATIIGKLTERYGELGIRIDATTGKISGYDAAMKKATERERILQLGMLKKALKETSDNVADYQAQITKLEKVENDYGGVVAVFGSLAGSGKKYEEAKEKLESEKKKLAKVRTDIATLENSGDPFKQGNTKNKAMLKAQQEGRVESLKLEYADLAKKMADVRKEQERELYTDTEKKIAEVNDKLKEQLDLSDKLAQNARERGNNGDLKKLQSERIDITKNAERQIAQIRHEAIEKQAEEDDKQADQLRSTADLRAQYLAELADDAFKGRPDRGIKGDPKLAAAYDAQRTKLLADAAKAEGALRAKADTGDRASIKSGLGITLSGLDKKAQDAALRNDGKGYYDALQAKVAATKKAEADIAKLRSDAIFRTGEANKKLNDENIAREKERADAVKDVQEKELGKRTLVLDQLRDLATARGDKSLAKAYDKLLKADAFEEQLKSTFGADEKGKAAARKLQGTLNAAQEVDSKYSSQGIFNAAGIQSLQGSQPLDRLVKSAEETARNTKKIKEEMGKNGLAFK